MIFKSIAASIVAATLVAVAPFAAQADGTEASGVRLQLGGRSASPAAVKSMEHGVAVWRAPPSLAYALEGGDDASRIKEAPAKTTEIIVVHLYHSRTKHLRTQGFYSGHPGKSRRFTQGFYSGPVDKGGGAIDYRWRR